MRTEDERVRRLLDAQARDLASEMFGTTRHWHKRIVRSGPHTLAPYRENPPDRVIGADDIVFAEARVKYEPYGVVAAILPFNWPPLHFSKKTAPAIAAGNTVVIKPGKQAPLAVLRLAELA